MHIAIIGCGVEGKSLAAYFKKKGTNVTVCDIRNINVHDFGIKACRLQTGPRYLENLNSYDLIFRSPGIPYEKKELHAARQKVTSLTKYFFKKCPCEIVGVTGTKGKGTTATLLYEMLRTYASANGRKGKVFLAGNIGTSPLDFLDQLKRDDIVILEISSFQLQDLDKSPHIAIVLGITPDHLDYHKDIEEYIEAKKNIVLHQHTDDLAVLDFDNEVSTSFAKSTVAKVLGISLEKNVKNGGFMKVASLIIKKGRTGTIIGEKGHTGIIGNHNLKNILAASVVANELSVPVEIIAKVVREFKGLPHRLEFVREIEAVRYYNDSFSTTPETAIAALRTFTNPLILIAGGSDKNVDYATLGEEIVKRINVKTVVLMGQTKAKIEHAIDVACAIEKKCEIDLRTKRRPVRIRNIPLELITADTYQEAFMVARMTAQPGDTVLLSPASASFDMFTNYKERGEIFKRFVNEV